MALPIAVLFSGGGSNFQSVIDRIESGVLGVRVTLAISNNPDAYGIERAKKHGIASKVFPHKDFESREAFEETMVEAIMASGAETVVLAGFMRVLTPKFINSFSGGVLNIHPAILPSFPGVHAQKQAADYGVRVSGCSVHFVDDKVDHGPIIIQAVLPISQGESEQSLGPRILKLEHRIYPQAIQWLAEGRLSLSGRKVILDAPKGEVAGTVDGFPFIVNPGLETGF